MQLIVWKYVTVVGKLGRQENKDEENVKHQRQGHWPGGGVIDRVECVQSAATETE
jgi:hypothetical protein